MVLPKFKSAAQAVRFAEGVNEARVIVATELGRYVPGMLDKKLRALEIAACKQADALKRARRKRP